jgi:hypothetical protein
VLLGCGIGDCAAAQLAEALANNTTIEVLELPSNHIGPQGVASLSSVLELHNITLKVCGCGRGAWARVCGGEGGDGGGAWVCMRAYMCV